MAAPHEGVLHAQHFTPSNRPGYGTREISQGVAVAALVTARSIGSTENPLVVRTHFSDEAAWNEIKQRIEAPVGPDQFRANVAYLDDRSYDAMTKNRLWATVSSDYDHSFIVVADAHAMVHAEHPLLVVDLVDDPGRELRAIPAALQSIENNLSLGNMDFSEFAMAADEASDKVFREFDPPLIDHRAYE
jgi:hypothetical protein